ncbi:hypothetical protein F5051DRAFT_325022, partial [Lentinula edodes]
LLGSLFSWCLFGISIVQLYIYHLSFPLDSYILQGSVYTVFVLDVFQSIVVATTGWHTLCTGWGHPSSLQFPGWTFTALPCVSGVVAAWVQTFFAWRIHSLSRWRVIPISIFVLALAQCAAAFAIGIGFMSLRDITLLHKVNMFARTIIWLGGAALADLVIALSMLYLLYSAKRNTTFKETERMISRLIRLTVETGVVTATSAIMELILFQSFQENNLHFTIALMLCKIYSNAFMASLNSRSGNSVIPQTSRHIYSTQFPSIHFHDSGISSSNQFASATVIQLERTTEISSDAYPENGIHKVWEILLFLCHALKHSTGNQKSCVGRDEQNAW